MYIPLEFLHVVQKLKDFHNEIINSQSNFYGGLFWSKLLYLIFGRCRVILVVPSNYLCSGFPFLAVFIIFTMSDNYFLHV